MGKQALYKAAAGGNASLVEQLLKKGADPLIVGDENVLPIHIAALRGFAEVIAKLLEHGGTAQLEQKTPTGETALHLAACYNRIDSVKVLLNYGANPLAVDWRGKIPKDTILSPQNASEVISLLEDAASKSRSNTDVNKKVEKLKELGNEAYKKRLFRKAIDYYSEAMTLAESNHLLYSNRAACFMELGLYMEAKMDAIKCVGLEPTFAKGFIRLANANLMLNELELARDSVHRGLESNPNDPLLQEMLQKVEKAIQSKSVQSEESVAGITRFPSLAKFLNARKDPVFAAGKSSDDSVGAWLDICHHIDGGSVHYGTEFTVLICNRSSQDNTTVTLSTNHLESWTVDLRNKVTVLKTMKGKDDNMLMSNDPNFIELNGKDISTEKPNSITLKKGEWLAVRIKFMIPGVNYESEALKKCLKLNITLDINTSTTKIECPFDLAAIRSFYKGFRPGFALRTDPSKPLSPQWAYVPGYSDNDDEEFDDEKYMEGFALSIKEEDSKYDIYSTICVQKLDIKEVTQAVEEHFTDAYNWNKKRDERRELKLKQLKLASNDTQLKTTDDLFKHSADSARMVASFNKVNLPEDACWTCNKVQEKMSQCGRCFQAVYCSAECQKQDWKTHKAECKPRPKQ